MPRFAPALALFATLAAAPLAAQDARDFQLPPAGTPTADPRAQGPVDDDGPVPIAPRVIATDRSARATPTPSPTPRATLAPAPAPTPSARAVAQTPRPTATTPRPLVTPIPQPSASVPAPISSPQVSAGEPSASPTLAPVTPASPVIAAPEPTKNESTNGLLWAWLGLATVASAGLIGLFALMRRRGRREAPEILVPQVAAPLPGEALALKVEAVKLDRSVMNATVGYRISLRNRTAQPLSNVTVEADLVSASRERPAEQQLAAPEIALTPRHNAARLGPGQSQRFEGQVRLPLSQANAIWQGQAALLVPLLRVRVIAEGMSPVATTLVIGQSDGQAARPQPFRLDEPPRSYAPLAQRVLDAIPARA